MRNYLNRSVSSFALMSALAVEQGAAAGEGVQDAVKASNEAQPERQAGMGHNQPPAGDMDRSGAGSVDEKGNFIPHYTPTAMTEVAIREEGLSIRDMAKAVANADENLHSRLVRFVCDAAMFLRSHETIELGGVTFRRVEFGRTQEQLTNTRKLFTGICRFALDYQPNDGPKGKREAGGKPIIEEYKPRNQHFENTIQRVLKSALLVFTGHRGFTIAEIKGVRTVVHPYNRIWRTIEMPGKVTTYIDNKDTTLYPAAPSVVNNAYAELIGTGVIQDDGTFKSAMANGANGGQGAVAGDVKGKEVVKALTTNLGKRIGEMEDFTPEQREKVKAMLSDTLGEMELERTTVVPAVDMKDAIAVLDAAPMAVQSILDGKLKDGNGKVVKITAKQIIPLAVAIQAAIEALPPSFYGKLKGPDQDVLSELAMKLSEITDDAEPEQRTGTNG